MELRGIEILGHVAASEGGLDFGGIDLHDADVVGAEFCAPAFGESGEGELAGGVGAARGVALGGSGGAHVDDGAGALLREVARGGAAAEHGTQDVGLPDVAEALGIEFDEGGAVPDGCVVHEHVESAERVEGRGE